MGFIHVGDEEGEGFGDVAEEAELVVADPLYRPAVRGNARCRFIELPHEGYSGRIWRSRIPIFIGGGFNEWMKGELEE